MTDPELARMRARREETRQLLIRINGRLAQEAESKVKASDLLPYTFGRHSTSWTPAHERRYQHHLGAARSAHREETGALQAKLRRKDHAIAARHLRNARRASQT
ncbi:hypothetical protein RM533_09365 [Croceicoccus sp. F390]|uniref:Uncharacterized protein n=1 Tax=Croceicoccus esteveae TaxID=3075597 RepID=A0ABU2ZIH8_9SPHN|nr:hypothetical protein [Croceicoccus sp. F390]MDT0576395.1 hypothetical protein [Croceicoccus sp. F390]